jgi:hypothetical protein
VLLFFWSLSSLGVGYKHYGSQTARQNCFAEAGGIGLVMRSVLEESVLVATVVQLARSEEFWM